MADENKARAKLFGLIPMWFTKNPQRVYLFGAIPLWKRVAVASSAIESLRMGAQVPVPGEVVERVAAPVAATKPVAAAKPDATHSVRAEAPVQTVPFVVPSADGSVDVIDIPIAAAPRNRVLSTPAVSKTVTAVKAPAAKEAKPEKNLFKQAMKDAKEEAQKKEAERAQEKTDPEADKFWRTYKHGATKRQLERQIAIQDAMGQYSAEEIGQVYDICSKNKRLEFAVVMANIEAIMINTNIYSPAAAVAAVETGMKEAGRTWHEGRGKNLGKYIDHLDSRLPAYVKDIERLCEQSKGSMNAKKVSMFEVMSNLEQIKRETGISDPLEAARAHIEGIERKRRDAAEARRAKPEDETEEQVTGPRTITQPRQVVKIEEKPVVTAPAEKQEGKSKASAFLASTVGVATGILTFRWLRSMFAASETGAQKEIVAPAVAVAAPGVVAVVAPVAEVVALAPVVPVEVAPPAVAPVVISTPEVVVPTQVVPPVESAPALAPVVPTQVVPPVEGASAALPPVAEGAAASIVPPVEGAPALAPVVPTQVVPPVEGASAALPPVAEGAAASVVPPVEAASAALPPAAEGAAVVPPVASAPVAATAHMFGAGLSNAIAAGLAGLVLIGSLLLPGKIGKNDNYQPPQPAPIVVVQPSADVEVKVLQWIKGGDTAFSTVEGIAVEQIRVQLGMEKLNPQDVKGDEARAVRQLVKDIARQNNLKDQNLIKKGSTLKVSKKSVMTTAERFGQFAR